MGVERIEASTASRGWAGNKGTIVPWGGTAELYASDGVTVLQHVQIEPGMLVRYDTASKLLVAFHPTSQHRPRVWRHYLFGVAMWISVVAVAGATVAIWPWSHKTLISLIFGGQGSDIGGVAWPTLIFIALMLFMLMRPGKLREYARSEEKRYRFGAERWSKTRRVTMCARFGFVHIWNLVIPFAIVVALMLAGAYLMWVYLRAYRQTRDPDFATEVATDAHAAYNRIALAVLVVVLAATFVTSL